MPNRKAGSPAASNPKLDMAWRQWIAAPSPSREKLQVLITEGGLDYRLADGDGPLVHALRQHRRKASRFVQCLLSQGFDANEPGGWVSPVFEACYQRDLNSLQKLLDHGANPQENGRAAPLGQACLGGASVGLVEALIKAGADIGSDTSFGGIVQAWSNHDDQQDAQFRPGKRWNGLANIIAAHAPHQWDEFASQMQCWAENNKDEQYVQAVDQWLASLQAGRILESSTPSVHSTRTRPRI